MYSKILRLNINITMVNFYLKCLIIPYNKKIVETKWSFNNTKGNILTITVAYFILIKNIEVKCLWLYFKVKFK